MKSSRRDLIKLTGGVAVGMALPAHAKPADAHGASGRVTLPYEPRAITKLAKIEINKAVPFTYPDASSPCLLIKMGRGVAGGVGPHEDVVAFSTLCTHQGCSVAYDTSKRTLKCPCHYTLFDAEKGGAMICGQATAPLPRIVLNYDAASDMVTAVAVEGLIYGRQANII